MTNQNRQLLTAFSTVLTYTVWLPLILLSNALNNNMLFNTAFFGITHAIVIHTISKHFK